MVFGDRWEFNVSECGWEPWKTSAETEACASVNDIDWAICPDCIVDASLSALAFAVIFSGVKCGPQLQIDQQFQPFR